MEPTTIDHQSQRFLSRKKISDFPSADKIYSLLNITEDIAEQTNIRVLDEAPEDNLILVHYFTCNNSISRIRGVIIDIGGENPEIIVESFPYTPEFEESQFENLDYIFDPEESTVTQAFEGTILRVFKGPKTGKWYMSTHRKIDGRNSRWSGPKFGEIFGEIWGSPEEYPFDDYFEEDKCYIFLVSHPENKLVCHTPFPILRLVGKYTSSNGVLLTAGMEKLNLIKPHPNVVVQTSVDVKDKDDLFHQVRLSNWKECSGLLVYNKKQRTCHKFMSSQYSILREVRGNEPNFRLRYLQLYKTDFGGRTGKFRELFQEKVGYFDEIENSFRLLIPYLEKLYINRYKNGDESLIPKEEHFILEKSRRNYDPELSLQNNLRFHVESSNARQINALIKHMCAAKK